MEQLSMKRAAIMSIALLMTNPATSQPVESFEVTLTTRFYEDSREMGNRDYADYVDEEGLLLESVVESATLIDTFRTSFLAQRGVPFIHETKHEGAVELSKFRATGTLDHHGATSPLATKGSPNFPLPSRGVRMLE
jgi:hypothetical protein